MGLPNLSPKVTIKNIATKTQTKIIINVIFIPFRQFFIPSFSKIDYHSE
jgi:hypothetical protein